MGILLSGEPGQSGLTTEHLVIISNIGLCAVTAFLAFVSLVMAVVMVHQDHDMIEAFKAIIFRLIRSPRPMTADEVTDMIGDAESGGKPTD